MKLQLSHPNLENQLLLDELRPTLLIVENPHEYYAFVTDLMDELQGVPSRFSCWEDTERVRGDKVGDVVADLFNFDVVDKKITSLLYKKLTKNYFNGAFVADFNKINSELQLFLQNLCSTVDFALDFGEISLDDVFKACSVKPLRTYQSYLEKIICYINLLTELKGTYLYAFVGLKDVLSDDDLRLLHNHCRLNKVYLLLIESSKKRPLLAEERAVIITDDLCEITENFD